jgi:probable phosphoglycerate mutase
MSQVQARMVQTITALAERHRDQVVAIVSHGDPLRCAVAWFLGISIDFILRFEISPGSLTVLEFGDWAPRVLCINHTAEAQP